MKKIIFGICLLFFTFCLNAKKIQTNHKKAENKSVKTTKKSTTKKATQKIKKVPSNKHNKRKTIPKKVVK